MKSTHITFILKMRRDSRLFVCCTLYGAYDFEYFIYLQVNESNEGLSVSGQCVQLANTKALTISHFIHTAYMKSKNDIRKTKNEIERILGGECKSVN